MRRSGLAKPLLYLLEALELQACVVAGWGRLNGPAKLPDRIGELGVCVSTRGCGDHETMASDQFLPDRRLIAFETVQIQPGALFICAQDSVAGRALYAFYPPGPARSQAAWAIG